MRSEQLMAKCSFLHVNGKAVVNSDNCSQMGNASRLPGRLSNCIVSAEIEVQRSSIKMAGGLLPR